MERTANLLAGLPLVRCEHRRGDRDWLRGQWQRARVLLLDAAGDTLCSAEGALRALGAGALGCVAALPPVAPRPSRGWTRR